MNRDFSEFCDEKMKIIDGDGLVVGRAATKIAKMLLMHEKVVLMNAEKMLMSGNKKDLISKYKVRADIKSLADPEHSPYWPRRPDLLVRRIVRGMLPWKSARGREALKRLRVYMGKVKAEKGINFELEKPEYLKKYVSINEICRELGWIEG